MISSSDATRLRLKILTDLDSGERSVDIDHRFIKPIFGGDYEARKWAASWHLEVSEYTTPGCGPTRWVSFSRPVEPVSLIPPSNDSSL